MALRKAPKRSEEYTSEKFIEAFVTPLALPELEYLCFNLAYEGLRYPRDDLTDDKKKEFILGKIIKDEYINNPESNKTISQLFQQTAQKFMDAYYDQAMESDSLTKEARQKHLENMYIAIKSKSLSEDKQKSLENFFKIYSICKEVNPKLLRPEFETVYKILLREKKSDYLDSFDHSSLKQLYFELYPKPSKELTKEEILNKIKDDTGLTIKKLDQAFLNCHNFLLKSLKENTKDNEFAVVFDKFQERHPKVITGHGPHRDSIKINQSLQKATIDAVKKIEYLLNSSGVFENTRGSKGTRKMCKLLKEYDMNTLTGSRIYFK